MATTISRDHVAWNGRCFDFSTALTVMLELDDGMWCYDCPSLSLLGCAPSPEDAIARFESEFAFLWDEIACESDDALLPQAQELKARLHPLDVPGVAAGLLAGDSAAWLREEREAAGDRLLERASGAPDDPPRATRAGSRPHGS